MKQRVRGPGRGLSCSLSGCSHVHLGGEFHEDLSFWRWIVAKATGPGQGGTRYAPLLRFWLHPRKPPFRWRRLGGCAGGALFGDRAVVEDRLRYTGQPPVTHARGKRFVSEYVGVACHSGQGMGVYGRGQGGDPVNEREYPESGRKYLGCLLGQSMPGETRVEGGRTSADTGLPRNAQ